MWLTKSSAGFFLTVLSSIMCRLNSETKDSELRQGTLDMSLGASVNAEKSGISYTEPYFGDASAVLVQGGQITSMAQLSGKTVAVIQNSVLDESTEKDENISVLQDYLMAAGG